MNESDIRQKLEYTNIHKLYRKRFIDKNRQGLGRINDVYFNRQGQFTGIKVVLDKLAFNPVGYFDVQKYGIEDTDDSLQIRMSKPEVENILKQLERAALPKKNSIGPFKEGEAAEAVQRSINTFHRIEVQNSGGVVLGRVTDVYMDAKAMQVKALLLNVPKVKKPVALPYQDITLAPAVFDKNHIVVILNREQEDALLALLRTL